MVVHGSGRDLIECTSALLDARYRRELVACISRTAEWLRTRPDGRRSVNALARDRHEKELFTRAGEADGAQLERAALRALKELSDGPLRVRVGVLEVPKQAKATEDLWPAHLIGAQRRVQRSRSSKIFLVCSKIMSDPILPGATSAVRRLERPDTAVMQVLGTIRGADPDAEIAGVDLDGFDEDVCFARKEVLAPFTLRLPVLLSRWGNQGPLALVLPSRPEISDVPIGDHPARDLRGLRTGRSGSWSDPIRSEIEFATMDAGVAARAVDVKVSGDVKVGSGSQRFTARIAHISDPSSGLVELPQDPVLVAVFGVADVEAIADLAVSTVQATDEHPDVAHFVRERHLARVFRGEQRGRGALHVDRAIAAIAFAAYRLDGGQLEPGVRLAASR